MKDTDIKAEIEAIHMEIKELKETLKQLSTIVANLSKQLEETIAKTA